ncbi:MAG: rhodanese-like domain-containing protein [Alphaproteobacteria bacterium]|jgi:rhodanese-related sulfurtransferase|nr:rhodanese-like domain-containing protein [Alphaproteobacteria bacterium]
MKDIKEITASELKDLIKAKEDLLIVDVRTAEEYNQVHLENALLMELSNFNQKELEEKCYNIDGLKKVVFQCRSGVRSKDAMKLLDDNFPYESYNLKGGIVSWAGNGYKIIMDDEE